VFGVALLAFDFLCNYSGRDADWLQHLDSDSCWRDPLIETDGEGEKTVIHRQVKRNRKFVGSTYEIRESAVVHLVAIHWFDRFGIERTAVDCGLFDGESKLQGGFVTLLSGESL
jgi:hypothetical protein